MGKIFDAIEKSIGETRTVSVMERRESSSPKRDQFDSVHATVEKERSPYNLNFDKNLIVLHRPQSFEAEQFKLLKTNILFPSDGKPARLIMVTSATPGEGKSFVAANLAISIAQNIDEHVLLMDCDLRLPTVNRLFGLGEREGLSEFLTGRQKLPELFCKTGINKLTILPAGRPPNNPSELLASEQMSNLIMEVRERYSDRYIIMDTAPPKLTAESSVLARKADGILVIVNAGKTKKELVAELAEKLGKEKIIGVVLNRSDIGASSYYGYGGYGKYAKYFNQK